jgi:nicotinate-nucleotide adenylyltransferase
VVFDMSNRIGILGGTFNPIHLGHLIMAQDAMEGFELTKVLFVPCDHPPHKNQTALVPAVHRVAMIEKAISGNRNFELLDIEIRRGGTTYTIDTLKTLLQTYKNDELFFVVGSDVLPELHTWHKIDEVLSLCRIITVMRPGFDIKKMNPEDLKIDIKHAEKILADAICAHQFNISSSDIRYRAAEGMSLMYLVPSAVDAYIKENCLYR